LRFTTEVVRDVKASEVAFAEVLKHLDARRMELI
jgi:hypothetical protein